LERAVQLVEQLAQDFPKHPQYRAHAKELRQALDDLRTNTQEFD
jgi:hypothetical protein